MRENLVRGIVSGIVIGASFIPMMVGLFIVCVSPMLACTTLPIVMRFVVFAVGVLITIAVVYAFMGIIVLYLKYCIKFWCIVLCSPLMLYAYSDKIINRRLFVRRPECKYLDALCECWDCASDMKLTARQWFLTATELTMAIPASIVIMSKCECSGWWGISVGVFIVLASCAWVKAFDAEKKRINEKEEKL